MILYFLYFSCRTREIDEFSKGNVLVWSDELGNLGDCKGSYFNVNVKTLNFTVMTADDSRKILNSVFSDLIAYSSVVECFVFLSIKYSQFKYELKLVHTWPIITIIEVIIKILVKVIKISPTFHDQKYGSAVKRSLV